MITKWVLAATTGLVFVALTVGFLQLIPSAEEQAMLANRGYFSRIHGYIYKSRRKPPRAMRRPNEWFYMQRAYPGHSIEAGKPAPEQARALQQKYHAIGAPRAAWTLKAPTNVPGRIADVAVDPINSSHVYVASSSGGIFETFDLVNWTQILDMAGTASMNDLEIDPTNASVIYTGTGECAGAGSSLDGNRVFKSTDAGAMSVVTR